MTTYCTFSLLWCSELKILMFGIEKVNPSPEMLFRLSDFLLGFRAVLMGSVYGLRGRYLRRYLPISYTRV